MDSKKILSRKRMFDKLEMMLSKINIKEHINEISCDELSVIYDVCKEFDVDIYHIFLPARFAYVVNGRYILAKWYRENTNKSTTEISKILWVGGKANHTHVIHAAKKANIYIKNEEFMKDCWDKIKYLTISDAKNIKYIRKKKCVIRRAKNSIVTKDI